MNELWPNFWSVLYVNNKKARVTFQPIPRFHRTEALRLVKTLQFFISKNLRVLMFYYKIHIKLKRQLNFKSLLAHFLVCVRL